MVLKTYTFSKKHNSTKQVDVSADATYSNTYLKADCDMDNPVFLVQDSFRASNYCYLEDLGRYYFIDKWVLGNNNIYELHCTVDALATYKSYILGQRLFIMYSTSNYNRWIKDDRVPIIMHGSEYISTQSAIVVDDEPLFEASDNETVVITTISQDYGLFSWVSTENKMAGLMAELSSSDSWFDLLSQQFGDAMGSIVQVMRLPVRAATIWDSNNESQIALGQYTTTSGSASCHELGTRHVHATGSIGIPATYADFRFTEPYCRAKLSIPFVGVVDFPLSELAPGGGINWRLDLDVLTGVVTYTFYYEVIGKPVASYSGNCGGLIPLATNQISNVANAVGGLAGGVVGAGASLLTGNPLPAVLGGINSAMSAFSNFAQSSSTVIGSYSGGRSEYTSRLIKLTVEKFATANEPANLADIEGRPLCIVDDLTNYTGYIQTVGAQVSIPCNESVKKMINDMLNNGIYIE